MIAFLKCYPGKYQEEYILQDSTNKQWVLKEYQLINHNIVSPEKIAMEESGNVYQYLVIPVNHEDLPITGSKLRVLRKEKKQNIK